MAERNRSISYNSKIIDKFSQLHNKLMNTSRWKFILAMLLSNLACIVLGSFLFRIFPIDTTHPALSDLEINYFYLVLVAPFVETIIFQAIPIATINLVLSYYRPDNKVHFSKILLSALFFASVHYFDYNYSGVKFLTTFFNGIVLGYIFESYYINGKKAFSTTFYVHTLTNLVSIVPMSLSMVLK